MKINFTLLTDKNSIFFPALFFFLFLTNPASAQFSGTVNVGTTETYTNFSGANGLFKAINQGTLSGNLTVYVTSDLVEDGTNALNQVNETGVGSYSIRVLSSGPRRFISQDPASSSTFMIGINGADRIKFDGGNDTLLVFRNTSNVIPSIVFQFNNTAVADTIQGCIIEANIIATQDGAISLKGTGRNKVTILNNVIRNYGNTAMDIAIHSSSDLNQVTVISNKISNCKSYGIFLPYIGDSCIISNNSIYYNLPAASVLAQRGIAISSGGGHLISGNYIGGSMPLTGGTPWVNSTTSGAFYGIYLIANSTALTSSVQGNTIANISMTGNASFFGIDISANANVGTDSGNVVGSPTVSNSIRLKGTNANTYGIYCWLLTVNIKNNIVANIADTSLNPNTFHGIYVGGAAVINVSKNQVFNIGATSNSTNSNKIYGIYMFGGNGSSLPYTISNNMISLGNNTVNHNVYVGIQDNGFSGNNMYMYYNTVRIAGTANGSTDSYAFSKTVNTNEYHLNNIYYNVRSGGTGKNFAVSKTSSAGTLSSNYNLIYALDSLRNCQWGTGNGVSFTQWKISSAGDFNSVNDTVDFISPVNLHIDTTSQANWNVNGRGIAISSIAYDIDNDARFTLVGLPTDIGADEFAPGFIEPPLANSSGAPAPLTTTSYYSGGRKIVDIYWLGNGTLPATQQVQYYSGTLPPNYTAFKTIFSYYKIQAPGGLNYTYNIRYYYTDAEKNNIPDGSLRIIKQDGVGPWNIIGGIAGSNADGKYIEAYELSSFSKFSLMDINMPLPVKLGPLVARKNNKDNILQWKTFTENNNTGFEIQRSADGIAYLPIYFMPSQAVSGNSSSVLFYDYTDRAFTGDKQFYRLKQVDINGSYTFSNVALVKTVKATDQKLVIWPNPVLSKVNTIIESAVNTTMHFVITDVSGRIVFTTTRQLQAGNNHIGLPAGQLIPGNYFIKMTCSKGCTGAIGRFVKK